MEGIQRKKRVGSLVNLVGTFVLEWKRAAALSVREVLARSHGLPSILGHLYTVSWSHCSSPKGIILSGV